MPALLRSLAAAVAGAALLGGCDLVGRSEPPSVESQAPDAVAEGATPSRQRVQDYLYAMRAKDVTRGRSQLCPGLHPTFDQAATGPNGDFARHFTVPAAQILDVRANGGKQEVLASVTVAAGGGTLVRSLRFTVAKGAAGWCIDSEVPVANPGPRPSGSVPASPVS
ncbi:MAG TPA: hypothetical protein VF462_15045 [Micromonosporaceae bacterium]